jgi:hypothetical protein
MFEEKTYTKIIVLIKTENRGDLLAKTSLTYENAQFKLSSGYLIISRLDVNGVIYTPINLANLDSFKTFE